MTDAKVARARVFRMLVEIETERREQYARSLITHTRSTVDRKTNVKRREESAYSSALQRVLSDALGAFETPHAALMAARAEIDRIEVKS